MRKGSPCLVGVMFGPARCCLVWFCRVRYGTGLLAGLVRLAWVQFGKVQSGSAW